MPTPRHGMGAYFGAGADAQSLSERSQWSQARTALEAAGFEVLGELWGQLLLVMSQADAHRLARILTGASTDSELRRSALAEALKTASLM